MKYIFLSEQWLFDLFPNLSQSALKFYVGESSVLKPGHIQGDPQYREVSIKK